ncbi:MAG: hypothetical protein UU42_C0007G0015 [Candidatus Woesebacteria bacterium GW2011_GWA1_41_13b]|uniref:Uncharacterized protein n=1 Tax=Candidatus Woesebacteria bacterium GW2011_GWA1_41_13b TaxID=1618555 RepID=A0A0G0USV0_9BACT|nr:MAG: hypothetical protein UU42_C0007G0015 [Candidatus Woesebacteria bacterium GW2011_GWA1_41_13b]
MYMWQLLSYLGIFLFGLGIVISYSGGRDTTLLVGIGFAVFGNLSFNIWRKG